MTKKTYIVGSTPILHNGVLLPPGADIELSFDEYRSLGMDLSVLAAAPPAQVTFHAPVNVLSEPAVIDAETVVSDSAQVTLPELVQLSAPMEAAGPASQSVSDTASDSPSEDQTNTDPNADPETLKPARRSSKKEGA